MQGSLLFDAVPSPLPEARDRLRARFGSLRDWERRDPVSVLVRAILGSRTYDAVSESVFARLKERYPGWRGLMTAPLTEIETAIAQVTFPEAKAPVLVEALRAVEAQSGGLSLELLARLSSKEALARLERIKGVGRKISASVLNFSTLRGRAFVIDTHLLRVGRRLGWLPHRAKTAELAYEPYMALIPEAWDADDLAEMHRLLKRLGQTVCRHDAPDCGACPLRDMCPSGRKTRDPSPAKAGDPSCLGPALAGAASPEALAALHARIAKLARSTARTPWGVLPFGNEGLDSCFPEGGLPLGRWHEIAGEGLERELPASAAGFSAAMARRCLRRGGAVLWALRREDLHPPALDALGLGPDRVVHVRADSDADVLNVIEAALRTRGVDAVVGEVDRIDLPAGKRLQLACEQGGATAFLLRRRLYGRQGGAAASAIARPLGSAATTRWRIAPAPSVPQDGEPGLGPLRWTAHLERCRGGRTGRFLLEMDDATSDVRVVARLADHEAQAGDGRAPAGMSPGSRDHGAHGRRAAAHGG